MSETEDFISEKDIQAGAQRCGMKLKPKRQPTEAQLLHLENIRVKAMEKKKEMREITEKANKQKEIDNGKLQKKLEKEQLAKKYEETIEKAKVDKIEVNLEPKPQPKPEPKQEPKRPTDAYTASGGCPEPKQEEKKKKVKKIIYKEVSESESSEEEVIIRRKAKSRPQSAPAIVAPVAAPPPQPSFHELVYQSSLDRLKTRMVDERCKHILSSVMPQYS